MRTLYLDCGMGVAGDMLTAALLELLPNQDEFIKKLNALGIPNVEFIKERSEKCGIIGTHISVLVHRVEENSEHDHDHEHHDHDHEHDHEHHDHDHDHEHSHDHEHHHEHEHHHRSMSDIKHIIGDHMKLPEKVREDILNIYGIIAEAEGHVHGVPVTDIHFHEVGTMDAIADITAVCMLMHELNPDEVIASPVHTGSGHVKCAHGILPIPAPATAYILQGIPAYGGKIEGELCTPTGAALLKYFVTRFGEMPIMKTQAIGYGMGKKDFPIANCVRAILGETENKSGEIAELSCNVDDMTGEAIGYAMEKLFEGGALEVFTVPVGMKKSRPGILIHVICKQQNKEEMIRLIFKYTTTIGIRETYINRYVLDRKIETIETTLGSIHRKISSGYGVQRMKYEYDDLSRIANAQGMSLQEVYSLLKSYD